MKTTFKSLSKAVILIITVGITHLSSAQDPRITQQFANPLRVNPAFMGPSTYLNIAAHTRSQWGSVDKGYSTHSFSAMYPLYLKQGSNKLDLGLSIINDISGAFSNLDMALAVGYNIKMSESNNLALSLIGGYDQRTLDTKNLTFDDQYQWGNFSASNQTGQTVLNEKTGYPDVGFGVMWSFSPSEKDENSKAYLGVSGYHMNEPNMTLTDKLGKLPRKLSLQGGLKVISGDQFEITPNFVATTQNDSRELLAGLKVDYHINEGFGLILGAWYRNPDMLAFLVGGEYKGIMLAYSYDLPNSNLSMAVTGLMTHEITLAYKLNMAKEKSISSTEDKVQP